MKRMRSSDCLGALISGSPSTDEKNSNSNNNDSNIYTRGFQTMTEGLEEDCLEETSGFNITERKRRLTADQVRALEKNFEFENKLDPERKIRLARELSLNPRQVAIWFQNRRARSKTKQLELNYGFLKANYDDLRLKFVELHQSKELLLLELNQLKSKIMKETTESNVSVKDEVLISEEDDCKGNVNHDDEQANFENNNYSNDRGILIFGDVKAGSSDCSDSSAILNEEVNINNNYYRPTMAISSSPTSDSMTISSNTQNQGHQQQTFVKMEEHRIFGGEESCDFFSDEQAPTLHWECQGPWN